MKTVAVIILNWNGIDWLKKFLPAAVKHTISPYADLIVADNGSTDESCQWVADNYPEVKIIRLEENYGFAKGYNKAIAATRYPFTLLLNSDVEVGKNWLLPLLEFMQNNPQAGACQPKILSWHHKNRFEYAGAAGGYLDCNGYPYCRGRIFASTEEDCGQYDGAPEEIAWASGAAFMVRTELYEKVGGLDELFFAHMEEIDLCCRIYYAGYRIYCVPQSKVWHVGGGSLNAGNPKKTYLNFRNNLLLLHKNMPLKQGKKKLFKRRMLDTLAWLMYIMKLDYANANAILKAHNDFRSMKKSYTTHPDDNFMAKMPGAKRNILWDYYVKRRKTY